MKKEDLQKIKDFYDNVITQQIIKPQEINEIYLLVEPNGNIMQPYFKKMRAISIFIQSQQQMVLDSLEEMFNEVKEIADEDNPTLSTYIPKDSAASPITVDHTQSHTEDDFTVISHTGNTETFKVKADNDKPEDELLTDEELLNELKSQYKNAETNLKRSITMRIKAIEKRLENK